jgi:hypothetical protein
VRAFPKISRNFRPEAPKTEGNAPDRRVAALGLLSDETEVLMSGDGFDDTVDEVQALGEAFYRAEGAVKGGAPHPRRPRRGNAGANASAFGSGGVVGGAEPLFEAGIVGAADTAVHGLLTSWTMAQAQDAMGALEESSQLARPLWRTELGIKCYDEERAAYERYCAAGRTGRPNGAMPNGDMEACVSHWVDEAPAESMTVGTQSGMRVTGGETGSYGGKTTTTGKIAIPGVPIGVDSASETNHSDQTNHQGEFSAGSSGAKTRSTPYREGALPECDRRAQQRMRELFP